MKNEYEIITLPAGCSFGSMPHSAHEWNEGFLWWRKRKACPGIRRPSKSEYDGWILPVMSEILKPIHRHYFKLTKGFMVGGYRYLVNPFKVGWQCECGDMFQIDRVDLKEEMVPAWTKVEQLWPS